MTERSSILSVLPAVVASPSVPDSMRSAKEWHVESHYKAEDLEEAVKRITADGWQIFNVVPTGWQSPGGAAAFGATIIACKP